MAAHDLAEVPKRGPGLGANLLAPLGPVLIEKRFRIHAETIFALREDCKRITRMVSIRAALSNAPMDVKAIRRKNLQMLQRKEGTLDAVAKRIGKDPNYLSQINTGYRSMGDATARAIESAYGHPVGWMDTLQELLIGSEQQNFEPIVRALQRVPLISWVSAGQQRDVTDPYQPGAAESWEEIEGPVSTQAFALRVRGDSMVTPDGQGFPDGSVIVVDPARRAKNRDFVIVRFPDTDEATFKQYIIDGPNVLLRALNPAYPPIIVTANAQVSGVVTEVIMRKRF